MCTEERLLVDKNNHLHTWLDRLRIAQTTVIAWLLGVQFFFWSIQGLPVLSIQLCASSGALLLLLALLAFSRPAAGHGPAEAGSKDTGARTWYLISSEILLLSIATTFGVVSGFQLLFLFPLARAAMLFGDRRQLSAAVLLTWLAYLGSAVPNQQLFIQSPSGFKETEGILAILFSRELLPWLLGGALVVITGQSIRSEVEISKLLEELSLKLESLSAENERQRIASEVNSSVFALVEKTKRLVDTASGYLNPDQPLAADSAAEDVLIEARDTAGEALRQVRQALQVLRD